MQCNGMAIRDKVFLLIIVVIYWRAYWAQAILQGKDCCACFTDEETEFQMKSVNCLKPTSKWQNRASIQTLGPWTPKPAALSDPRLTGDWPLLEEVRAEANKPKTHPLQPGTQFSPGEQCFLKEIGGK